MYSRMFCCYLIVFKRANSAAAVLMRTCKPCIKAELSTSFACGSFITPSSPIGHPPASFHRLHGLSSVWLLRACHMASSRTTQSALFYDPSHFISKTEKVCHAALGWHAFHASGMRYARGTLYLAACSHRLGHPTLTKFDLLSVATCMHAYRVNLLWDPNHPRPQPC